MSVRGTSSSEGWDVLGFGAVAVDDLIYVDHIPAPDTKAPVKAQQRQGGGLAGTALVTVSRLEGRAAYCGVLGDDELSHFTLRELEREGVDCAPVIYRPEARPVHSIVVVDQTTGQRCIYFSHAGVTEPPPEVITPELIANCRVLFVDNTAIAAGLQAAGLARARGIPVVGDVEYVGDPRLPALISQIDHLILSVVLAAQLAGESEPAAIVHALSAERACCVATAGAHGCWYAEHGGEVHHVPAFPVQAVDTTGCGDVFHGAYAASLARGEDVRRAVLVATAAAGLKATEPGGRSGIPTRAVVERFLAEHSIGT